VRREKLNWIYLTTFDKYTPRTELIVYLYIQCT